MTEIPGDVWYAYPEKSGVTQPTSARFELAAERIGTATSLVAFTGAGVSVESGIPPFRGEGGIWERWDPTILDIRTFLLDPEETWRALREIFFWLPSVAEPNLAHRTLAYWEKTGLLSDLVTMNIDGLHTRAGSVRTIEYHGSLEWLVCMETGRRYRTADIALDELPPRTEEGALLKPDIVFFGERIPPDAIARAERAVERADVLVVIGTTGAVFPAASLPIRAKENGAFIIEINPSPSDYTSGVTDLFIQNTAVGAFEVLAELVDR